MHTDNIKFNGLLIDELIAIVEKVEEYAAYPFELKELRTKSSSRDNVTSMHEYASRLRHQHEVHEVA